MVESSLSARWLPVPGFVGYYEVSDQGSVRSVDRVVVYRNGYSRLHRGCLKIPTVGRDGHLQVSLCKGGKQIIRCVHQLVLLAFVGPAPEGTEGCHEDGDPANNWLYNLGYDTHANNMLDAVRHGTSYRGLAFRNALKPRRSNRTEQVQLARINVLLAIRRA